MTQHWNVAEDCLEISEMPFYWRMSDSASDVPGIPSRLRISIIRNEEHDYLTYEPSEDEWAVIDLAYRQNENIGFLNPQSGQLDTYGSSVNNFFVEVIQTYTPKTIYEIGCGAGFSIQFLKERGWDVTGIDPSEYSYEWSKQLDFTLLNTFFCDGLLSEMADFIYCNDVFEHVRNVEEFCTSVYNALGQGGVFCIATTNSSQSIKIGDISMLEHQHVNMFTERSVYSILASAGFADIKVQKGTYGNTFHIVARKLQGSLNKDIPQVSSEGFFQRARQKIERFNHFYFIIMRKIAIFMSHFDVSLTLQQWEILELATCTIPTSPGAENILMDFHRHYDLLKILSTKPAGRTLLALSPSMKKLKLL